MHYLDRDTFVRVMNDVWQNCSVLCCGANAVKVAKTGSIRFLETQVRRRRDMRCIAEIMKIIREMTWPYQNI